MNAQAKLKRARVKKVTVWYNQIPNFFWSIVCFTPIIYFCYQAMDRRWIYVFSVLSLLTAFLPKAFFSFIQLGRTPAVYTKIGIRFVKKFTQDGDLINRWIRKKYPQYKLIDTSRSIQHYFNKSYMYEKFHFAGFVFFLLTSLYAVSKNQIWWALLIGLVNVIYNMYPMLLQQYNRLRLTQAMKKHPLEKSRAE